jgi:GTPase Era involved in 16S rRNA processing
MVVAGLLTQDQLQGIFLNVDELAEGNRRFTQSLKDSIETALDEADEDLCAVHIGKMFLRAEEDLMAAFKSYCTRQVRIIFLRESKILALG